MADIKVKCLTAIAPKMEKGKDREHVLYIFYTILEVVKYYFRTILYCVFLKLIFIYIYFF
jgi:hypothetical protein